MSVRGPSIVRVTPGPDGPVVTDLRQEDDGSIIARDHSTGTETRVPAHPLLGDDDPGHGVVPVHPAVAAALRRFGDHRIGATGTPYHDLLPVVLAQRVTSAEATAQWRRLCLRWGTPVEVGGVVLHCPPGPDVLARIPYHEMHSLGIERRRADTLRQVAVHGHRLMEGWPLGATPQERTRALCLIPGVGPWTAAVAGYTAFGDPDALEVGDFHAKNTVAHALTGRHRGTDEEMCALLEPYAGDRQRVLVWLRMAGHRAPAHGPRRRIVSIARM